MYLHRCCYICWYSPSTNSCSDSLPSSGERITKSVLETEKEDTSDALLKREKQDNKVPADKISLHYPYSRWMKNKVFRVTQH